MRHHDFDAEAAEASGEPITFTLGGVTFICVHPFPLGSTIEFAREVGEIEDSGLPADRRGMKLLAAQDRLLRSWITPGQHAAWAQAVAGLADIRMLQRVVAWVLEEATGRPTSAPSSSPTPVDSVGVNSTGA